MAAAADPVTLPAGTNLAGVEFPFMFPLEIRRNIYEHLLRANADKTLGVRVERRFQIPYVGPKRIILKRGNDNRLQALIIDDNTREWDRTIGYPSFESGHDDTKVQLKFLRVSKSINADATQFLYGETKFIFDDMLTMSTFIQRCKPEVARHIRLVRVLKWHTEPTPCIALAMLGYACPNLAKLVLPKVGNNMYSAMQSFFPGDDRILAQRVAMVVIISCERFIKDKLAQWRAAGATTAQLEAGFGQVVQMDPGNFGPSPRVTPADRRNLTPTEIYLYEHFRGTCLAQRRRLFLQQLVDLF